MSLTVFSPFPLFTDIDGTPLEDGYIYIGDANYDPIINPTAIYWDAALSIPAPQPIRTIGGYPSKGGSPGRIYMNSETYSITVLNKNGEMVYTLPSAAYGFQLSSQGMANVQTFYVSATWVKPTQASIVMVELWGGGGGGGGGGCTDTGDTCSGGSGGGGGGMVRRIISADSIPTSVFVTIGAGGAGGTSRSTIGNGFDGENGDNSTFGAYYLAFGGEGGDGGKDALARLGGKGGGYYHSTTPAGEQGASASDALGYVANMGGAGGGVADLVEQNWLRHGGCARQGGAGGGGGGPQAPAKSSCDGGDGGTISDDGIAGGGGYAGSGNGGEGGNGSPVTGSMSGSAGGGGASSVSHESGSGGNGSFASGGGGGGASFDGQESGTGGAGGGGCARITTW